MATNSSVVIFIIEGGEGKARYLGMVYTMDNEVVKWQCKSIDWLLNSSHDHFNLHQGKNGKGTMKVEVPKIHFSMPDKCIVMVQRVLQ